MLEVNKEEESLAPYSIGKDAAASNCHVIFYSKKTGFKPFSDFTESSWMDSNISFALIDIHLRRGLHGGSKWWNFHQVLLLNAKQAISGQILWNH